MKYSVKKVYIKLELEILPMENLQNLHPCLNLPNMGALI